MSAAAPQPNGGDVGQQNLDAVIRAFPNIDFKKMTINDLFAAANQALVSGNSGQALRSPTPASGNGNKTPKSPPPAEFIARVKLYTKEGDDGFPTNGSHEIITIDANSEYGDLRETIKTAFLKIQRGNAHVRSNVHSRCWWSTEHEISCIKAVWNPSADTEWAGVGVEPTTGDVTVITEENCALILVAMKSAVTLPTLSVTIRVPGRG
jgi:hypothetical protein